MEREGAQAHPAQARLGAHDRDDASPARERLLTLPRESEWVFTTLRGTHYTPSSRSHHWNRVRCTVGLGDVDLYTATRHHFVWYAWNVLGLDPADIGQHFGHQDGGELCAGCTGISIRRSPVSGCARRSPQRPRCRSRLRRGAADRRRNTLRVVAISILRYALRVDATMPARHKLSFSLLDPLEPP